MLAAVGMKRVRVRLGLPVRPIFCGQLKESIQLRWYYYSSSGLHDLGDSGRDDANTAWLLEPQFKFLRSGMG